jgi:hypothetical protein
VVEDILISLGFAHGGCAGFDGGLDILALRVLVLLVSPCVGAESHSAAPAAGKVSVTHIQ